MYSNIRLFSASSLAIQSFSSIGEVKNILREDESSALIFSEKNNPSLFDCWTIIQLFNNVFAFFDFPPASTMIVPSYRAGALLLLISAGAGAGAASSQAIGVHHQEELNDMLETLAAVGATPTSTKHKRGNGSGQIRGSSRQLDSSSPDEDEKPKKKGGKKKDDECKKGKDLEEFPQWQAEVGYWIGEYTLLDGSGAFRVDSNWPYPYNAYTGFITGNIKGGAYRQRNVFLYPPNTKERCDEIENSDGTLVFGPGKGKCGENGNSLVFSADQSGCSKDGSISGSFFIPPSFTIDTTTELVGANNALLYQVFGNGFLTQSQLTTIHGPNQDKRTRTAQQFAFGSSNPSGTSYYRERKVSEKEFYDALQAKIEEYNILFEDLCTKDGFAGRAEIYNQEGFETCRKHLEQSFEL